MGLEEAVRIGIELAAVTPQNMRLSAEVGKGRSPGTGHGLVPTGLGAAGGGGTEEENSQKTWRGAVTIGTARKGLFDSLRSSFPPSASGLAYFPDMVDRERLRQLPKADLHCHLDGSVRPATLLELAGEVGLSLPARDEAGVRRAMRVRDGSSLETYLACFTQTLGVLQTAAALERVAYELGEDAAAEGVWYLEARFAPLLHTGAGLSQSDAITAVHRGLERATCGHGIETGIIVCALRQLSAEASLEAAHLAVAHRASGVVGFDLAGAEAGHPASSHASAFLYAREHDLSCTCHAGEGDGASSVRAAVQRCGASRIGHGTRMIEDPALTAYVIDHQIPVEICLTSNVQTGAARDYAAHPLQAYAEAGMSVVLCTDNRLMSDTMLTDEYVHAARTQGLSFSQLAASARAGFAHAFQPWATRQALLRRFDAALAALERAESSA